MAPTAYTVQMTAAETALERARDVGDGAAMLAALATMTRLVRLRYGAAKLARDGPLAVRTWPGGSPTRASEGWPDSRCARDGTRLRARPP